MPPLLGPNIPVSKSSKRILDCESKSKNIILLLLKCDKIDEFVNELMSQRVTV
jgi:hypothetical protein